MFLQGRGKAREKTGRRRKVERKTLGKVGRGVAKENEHGK